MRSTRKRFALALLTALTMLALTAAAHAATSGTCGTNATWEFSGGTLTISGTGAVDDTPWDACPGDIKTVEIGSGITALPDYAFYGCSSISSVTLPNTLETIGRYAFSLCHALTSVTIPDSVTTIGNNAFGACQKLTSVTLGSGVETIESHAFYNCPLLTTIHLPASLTAVDARAFLSNPKLTSVTVAAGNSAFTSVDGILYSKDKTALVYYPSGRADESFTLPTTVRTVGQYAFSTASKLKELTIYKGLERMEVCAGENAGLTTVYYSGTADDWAAVIRGDYALESSVVVHFSLACKTASGTVVTDAADATCTQSGYTGDTRCAVCRAIVTKGKTIAKKGHKTVSHAAQAPTCTQVGWDSYVTCQNCSYTTYSERAKLGHSWSDWAAVTAPTYVDDGLEMRSCEVCSTEEENVLPATGEIEAAKILTSFSAEKLNVESIPPHVKVVFACYSSGKLLNIQIFESGESCCDHSFPLSETDNADEMKLFFLDSFWRPIAEERSPNA